MGEPVEVIVPRAGRCSHREAAWRFVKSRLEYPVVEAWTTDVPFVKALAVMPAVERSEADIIVLHDADVVCDLSEAICAVSEGFPWAMPHRTVHRLSEAGSEAYMASQPYQDFPMDQPPYAGIVGGGIIVARREVLLDTPMDPRFMTWGQEDEAFGVALWTMYGMHWRGEADLIHLWHQPSPRLTRKVGSLQNQEIARLYHAARLNPEKMRIVLDQAKEALPSHNRHERNQPH